MRYLLHDIKVGAVRLDVRRSAVSIQSSNRLDSGWIHVDMSCKDGHSPAVLTIRESRFLCLFIYLFVLFIYSLFHDPVSVTKLYCVQ